MNIDDLRSYLVIARYANLRAAAQELHQTPSALSKALRRLEDSLSTPLFDRAGKSLRLNAAGEHLAERAQALVALADVTAAEFQASQAPQRCRLLGPSILQAGFGAGIARRLAQTPSLSELNFVSCYEDAALTALNRGEGDLALVTGVALTQARPNDVEAVPLATLRMQLAVGPGHALAARRRLSMKEVLTHDFACVDRSPFCGLPRGGRSDGWRDDAFPRRIRYWAEDLQLLLALVQQGAAVAYVPDFAFSLMPTLVHLGVRDCPYECVEQIHLAYRRSAQRAWAPLIEALQAEATRSAARAVGTKGR